MFQRRDFKDTWQTFSPGMCITIFGIKHLQQKLNVSLLKHAAFFLLQKNVLLQTYMAA